MMGLSMWGPSDVVSGMRAILGWTDDAVGVIAALPERISGLLDDVDVLIVRITAVADRVDAVIDRTEGVITRAADVADGADGVVTKAGAVAADAAGVIDQSTAVAERAGEVVAQAAGTSSAAGTLLSTYAPIAEQAAPLARRFVEEFSPEELHAAIRLIDQLPALTEHLETDIMPILATLDRVGPDVHDLLDVLKDVRQAINGIPGFGYFRRRGERDDAEAGP